MYRNKSKDSIQPTNIILICPYQICKSDNQSDIGVGAYFVDVYQRNYWFTHLNIRMNLRKVVVLAGITMLNRSMIGAS